MSLFLAMLELHRPAVPRCTPANVYPSDEGQMNETERLASLRELDLLDTSPEKEFDELVHLASAVCSAPISLVSLVDEKRQWFKATVGLDTRETGRDVSFCAHAILQPEPFIVEDAMLDERFQRNALVTADPNIRFYAGVPIHAPNGHPLGTLCVIDTVPRQLTKSQREALVILGVQVEARIELRARQRDLEKALQEKSKLAQQLQFSQHVFWSFLEHSPSQTYLKDDRGRYVFYNREFARFLGITQSEWLGHTVHDVLPQSDADSFHDQDLRALASSQPVEGEDSVVDASGNRQLFHSVKFSFIGIDGRRMLAGISQNVTEQIEREKALAAANAQLELLATQDSLTGLANRRVFDERAGIEFARSRRSGGSLSILLMDIDDFKKRNDVFGHAAGDDALCLFGSLLSECIRIGDVAARIGGEEFACLLPDTDADGAIELAMRVQALLQQRAVGDAAFTVSVGVASVQPSSSSWKEVLARADSAMYLAKKSGKNKIVRHSTEIPGSQTAPSRPH